MTTMEQRRYKLYPKQQQFFSAKEREVLYCGGSGAGKSHALCLKLFSRASVPGAVEGLCRKSNASIPNSFLMAWKKLIPSNLWTINKTEQTIHIHNGGVIMYFGCDDEDRLGSREMTGCAVEEVSELSKKDWAKIVSLCRMKAEGLANQIYGCTNPPANIYHWVAEYWDVHGSRSIRNRLYIETNADDIEADPEYISSLEALDGAEKERLRYGKWASNTGLVFGAFGEQHLATFEGDRSSFVVGIDDGYSDPFVAIKAYIDSDRRVFVDDIFYRKGMYEQEKVLAMSIFASGARHIATDNCEPSLIRAFRESGLPAIKSRKGIESGITAIRNRLVIAGDGKPRLFVNPNRCVELIKELRTYAYNTDGTLDKKGNDHCIDALVYLLFSIQGNEKPAVIGRRLAMPESQADSAQSKKKEESVSEIFRRLREGNMNFGFE